MNLILNNEDGRAYISDFTVSKMIYKHLTDKYENIQIISVKSKLNSITLKINGNKTYSYEFLEEIQEDTAKLLKENLGMYVENFNIVLG